MTDGLEKYLIDIDLESLCRNLSAAGRQEWSEQEARALLKDMGFEARGDGWLCDALDIGKLKKSEIKGVNTVPVKDDQSSEA